jgi:hypothetical protein
VQHRRRLPGHHRHGYADAAASISALLYNSQLDLRQTYFIIAGIAGINPKLGTVGWAAWAKYAVDYSIAHEIDAREIPAGWPTGYFGVGTASPTEKPAFDYQTEVFKRNAALADRAYTLSKGVQLSDSPCGQRRWRYDGATPERTRRQRVPGISLPSSMRLSLPALLVSLSFGLPSTAIAAAIAAASDCARLTPPAPFAQAIARAALDEYAQFNGHRINAGGALWKAGAAESETAMLRDPDTGAADAAQPGRYAWRRVWEYWLTLERHVPGEAWGRKVVSVPGLLEDPLTLRRATETRLRDLIRRDDGSEGSDGGDDALRQSAVRAALNDSAWSAAFISYLMDKAGLDARQFRFASAHWQYVQRALQQPDGYAYRACDPRTTVPAVGDLLCYSRGAPLLKDFAAWRSAALQPGFAAPAHCEVVVEVDTDARKIETVGGNVVQSVARRRLRLNQANLLSLSHDPERHPVSASSDCGRDKTCEDGNLNLQYWGMLLQLKAR